MLNLFKRTKPGAAMVAEDGNVDEQEPPVPPIPSNDKIGRAESLIDVLGLVGNALVLKNGTFVHMIEVAPVDLESVDPNVKHKYWIRFADAVKAIRAPLSVQIVITTRPQDISDYVSMWTNQARKWSSLAEQSQDLVAGDRRARMAHASIEQAAFLAAMNEHLTPMQQRYLVVTSYNPFPEALRDKKREHILSPKVVRESLEKMDEQIQLVQAALSRIGLPLYELDPAAMCEVLWHHYHHPQNVLGGGLAPGNLFEDFANERTELNGSGDSTLRNLTQCPSREEFQAAAMDPDKLADLLAPAIIDEQPAYLRVGDVVGRGYSLFDFDVKSEIDLSSLLSFNADMTHALYLVPSDPAAIRRLLREKETELKSGQVSDTQRGIVTNWGRQDAINSTERLRAEVEMTLQAPFSMHWFAMIWANDLLTLNKKCQQFETRLKVMGIRFHRANRLQLNVFQSLRPLNRRAVSTQGRNMSAESLGPLFPFARCEYYEQNGWHFGIHRGNGLLVRLDPMHEGRDNASQLVLGTPGGGKSVYLKQTIDTLLSLGHRVFVFDAEREYARLAVDYHAPYLELGKRGQPPLIPLATQGPNARNAWIQALVEMGEMYESLSGRALGQSQIDSLAFAYQEVMAESGFLRDDPATWDRPVPQVRALVERLKADPQGREVGRVLGYVSDALVGGYNLNILDINMKSDAPWQSAIQTLSAFIEVILGGPMSSSEFNVMVRCYEATMTQWGIVPDDPGTWDRPKPTLSALVQVLSSDPAPEARNLASVLYQYSHGIYAGMFNCATNVNLDVAQFAVFGMRSLRENVEKSLAPVFAWQVLQYAWNTAVSNAPSGQPFHLVIDESWFILQQNGSAARLEAMARSFRKYNASLILATHEMGKLINSPEAAAIANVGGIRVLFGQETDSAAQAIGAIFGLSQPEQNSLLRATKGEGLLLVGNRVRVPIYVAVNPNRLEYLSTNVAQQRAIARASGRRAEPVV